MDYRLIRLGKGVPALGIQGEHGVTRIEIDAHDFADEFPSGTAVLICKREDGVTYPIPSELADSIVSATLEENETLIAGKLEFELQWFVVGDLAKSRTYCGFIQKSIGAPSDPPAPEGESWVEQIADLVQEVSDKVDEAVPEGGTAGQVLTKQADGSNDWDDPQGGGGTGDHTQLTNHDADDQHPIGSITGLRAELDGKQPSGSYATSAELEQETTARENADEAQDEIIEMNTAARHTHANKSVLDGITSALIEAWNSSVTWIESNATDLLGHLTDSVRHITALERSAWGGAVTWIETNGTNVLNHLSDAVKHITAAERSAWGGAVTWVETNATNLLNHLTDSVRHITAAERTAWTGKQDAISDLESIREGAAAGATALQTETDPTVPAWAKAQQKPTYTAQEVGAATPSDVQTAVGELQEQIDALISKSDVVDVVADYAALQSYDTSTLLNNDVVKVLSDSTHNDGRSYYRWTVTGDTGTWTYVGTESIGYTKAETDNLLNAKQPTISDLSTIRSGAAAGATAYQKPSAGIPKADLASAVQASLGLADTALQEHQSLAAYRTSADQDVIDAGKESKGKITISGVEKTANAHTVTIVTNGVTTNLTLVGVS